MNFSFYIFYLFVTITKSLSNTPMLLRDYYLHFKNEYAIIKLSQVVFFVLTRLYALFVTKNPTDFSVGFFVIIYNELYS